jgi:hypothetical protein
LFVDVFKAVAVAMEVVARLMLGVAFADLNVELSDSAE